MRPIPLFNAFLTIVILAFSPVAGAQNDDNLPLKFERLDLNDGQTLRKVEVKSYDATTDRLLIVTDGKAMTVPLKQIPPPFDQLLKLAPASGASVSTTQSAAPPKAATSTVRSAPRPAAPARVTTTSTTRPATVRVSAPQPTPKASPTRPAAVPRTTSRTATAPSQTSAARPVAAALPARTGASVSQHQAAARARADRFFRHEHRPGSDEMRVLRLSLDMGIPQPVAGWDGRYRTAGTAMLVYSGRGTRQHVTNSFEVITEQKEGAPMEVIFFDHKSR